MHLLQKKILRKWDEENYSIAELAQKSGLSESSLRRFREGKSVVQDTLEKVAAAVGVDFNAEELYFPNSGGCATSCPARKAMNETIQMITAMNAESLRKEEELYERGIAQKNKQLQEQEEELKQEKAMNEARIRRWRIATVSLLIAFVAAVGFTFYLVFYDFANPSKGILQYLTVEQVLEYLEDAGRITR